VLDGGGYPHISYYDETAKDLKYAAYVELPGPQAGFTASPTSGFAPLPVTFANTSTGYYTSSLWGFGDGQTSTQTNPSHTYQTAGTRSVTLTVSGTAGTDTLARTDYIAVYEPVKADFTASPRFGPPPLDVTFTDASSGPVATWEWDLGDREKSTLQHPTHIYITGTYTVSLTVRAAGELAALPGGMDTVTKPDYIRAQEQYTVYLPLILRNR
jgi:PKD repeat protein